MAIAEGIKSWTSYLGLADKDDEKSESSSDITPSSHPASPQSTTKEPSQQSSQSDTASKEDSTDYKALYEETKAKFDNQGKAIELSKKTAKQNRELQHQLSESKRDIERLNVQLNEATERGFSDDDIVELKIKIKEEEQKKADIENQQHIAQAFQKTQTMIETQLPGFDIDEIATAAKQQAKLMGFTLTESNIARIKEHPLEMGPHLISSLYLIAKKDAELGQLKKELEVLKSNTTEPGDAFKNQPNVKSFNDDFNSKEGTLPSDTSNYLATASTAELNKILSRK